MWNDIWLWFGSISPSLQGAIVTSATTAVVAVLSVGGVMLQVNRQAVANRKLTRETEAQKLKLQIYESAAATIDQAVEAVITYCSLMQGVKSHFVAQSSLQSFGIATSPTRSTFAEAVDRRFAAASAVGKASLAIETWQIIEPKLDLFISGFTVAGEAFDEATSQLMDEAVLMMRSADGSPRPFPAADQIDRYSHLLDMVLDRGIDLRCQLGDLKTELQNLLLGDLFNKRLPYREPIDPDLYALRLDRYDALKTILANTPTGRRNQEQTNVAKAQALEKIRQRRDTQNR